MIKTHDQVKALELLKKWYASDDLFATLEGPAGSGKTTITKDFINGLGLLRSKFVVSAPTHKAKKEIQRSTGYAGTTIQKLLGLRPNTDVENFNINRPQFDPLGRDEIQYYTIILIDEISMINDGLDSLLKKKAKRYGVKILFIGDECQLLPVNQKTVSKSFYANKYRATLTTVVRQGDDNPMSIALVKLREDVLKGTDEGIRYLTSLKSSIVNDKGFMCLPKQKDLDYGDKTFGDEVLKLFFSSEYQVDSDFVKFISYTNASVEAWSGAFREKILNEKSKNLINVGEYLVGYNSITNYKTNDLIIENSEEYITTNVIEGDSPLGIKGYYVDLENEESGSRRVFIVDHTDITLFKDICNEKLTLAQNKGGGYWKSFYNFKNKHLLLESVYKDDNKPKKYWNLLCKKDLYYNYGVTVHKSQGSTYSNTAVNLTNLYMIRDMFERSRLLYVALSRAKSKNLILVK